MVARGWACLHTVRVPVPKIPPAKPCISITCKLIQDTPLQVLYSGHLQKTAGWGSYLLVHTPQRDNRVQPGSAGILPASIRFLLRAGRMPALPKRGTGWAIRTDSGRAHPLQKTNGARISTCAVDPRSFSEAGYLLYFPYIPTLASYVLCFPYIRKNGGVHPCGKCRRADIFDFSPDISCFVHNAKEGEKSWHEGPDATLRNQE